ncbi:hypothetical protein GCM10027202_31130 [Microvirgula curvata]
MASVHTRLIAGAVEHGSPLFYPATLRPRRREGTSLRSSVLRGDLSGTCAVRSVGARPADCGGCGAGFLGLLAGAGAPGVSRCPAGGKEDEAAQ